MWVACSTALIGIFVCQELLEGLFTTGHAPGLSGVFGFGGWWAIPSSLCIGLLLAAWLHGARWALRAVAHRRAIARPQLAGPAPLVHHYLRLAALAPPQPLIDGSCSRGPPGR